MAVANTWKLLEFGQKLPRLLIKTRFDDEGYEIQLTDLSRIWSESLKHDAIVKRAAKEGCSIDPSESDQYQILLEKIDGAIRGTKGTSIQLRHDGQNNLSLDLSAPLPGSLPSLMWSIRCQQLRQSDIAEELVRPLLQQANHLRHQVQFLVDEVTAKDRVIAKITDRLESSGNDLTTVFPGVSNIKTNRKRSQREQLESHVKGLADFDEKTWRASIAPKIDHFEVSPNLLNDLLSDLPAPDSSDFNESAHGEWWKRLQGGHSGEVQHKTNHASNRADKSENNKSVEPKLPVEESLEDDEFQKQETPPHLKHRSRARVGSNGTHEDKQIVPETAPPAICDDDETEDEDEDDLDAVPSHTSSSQTKGRSQQEASQKSAAESEPRPVGKLGVMGGKATVSSPGVDGPQPEREKSHTPSQRKSKLGAIGGKNVKSASPEPAPVRDHESPPQHHNQKAKLGTFRGKKRSATPETEDEAPVVSPPRPRSKLGTFGGRSKHSASPTEPDAAQDQPSPAKPKHRLGAFGGKKQDSSQKGVAEERENSPAVSPRKHKLGTVGGRASARTTESPPPSAQKAEKVEKDSEEPEAEETPEERANRKRELLKKEMQEKHPVKKKRKF